MKMDAVGLFVTNVDKSVCFYTDVFDMKANWDGGPYAEFQMENGYRLMLYGRKDFEEMISQKPDYPAKINGTMELALDYPEFDDVDKEFDRIIKLGAVPVLKPTNMPWGQRTSYVTDPDGNLIEIGSFGKKD